MHFNIHLGSIHVKVNEDPSSAGFCGVLLVLLPEAIRAKARSTSSFISITVRGDGICFTFALIFTLRPWLMLLKCSVILFISDYATILVCSVGLKNLRLRTLKVHTSRVNSLKLCYGVLYGSSQWQTCISHSPSIIGRRPQSKSDVKRKWCIVCPTCVFKTLRQRRLKWLRSPFKYSRISLSGDVA